MPCGPLRNLLITLTAKLFQQECSSKCLSPDLYAICSYCTFSCFLSLSFVLRLLQLHRCIPREAEVKCKVSFKLTNYILILMFQNCLLLDIEFLHFGVRLHCVWNFLNSLQGRTLLIERFMQWLQEEAVKAEGLSCSVLSANVSLGWWSDFREDPLSCEGHCNC